MSVMMHRQLQVITFATVSLVFPPSFALSALDPDRLEMQRKLLPAIEKKLKSKNSQLYYDNLDKLKDYPLLPYLEWLDLGNRLSALSQQDIDSYVSNYSDLPHSYRLQRQWLNHLAKKKSWQDYLTAYERSDITGARYQCLNGIALHKQGRHEEAWTLAAKLWLVGKSQNKACDPLFTAWKKAGQLTQKLAFERFWLAAKKGNTQLARYIDKSINHPELKKKTQLFWKFHHKPHQLAKTKSLNLSSENHRFIFLHGLKRLARRDMDQAIKLWLVIRDAYPFTLNQIAQLDRWMSIRLAKNFTDNASQQIAKLDPLFSYPEVTEWRIRLTLTDQDWDSVLKLIKELPEDYAKKSRWRYWQAVATLGKENISITDRKKPGILNTNNFAELSKERGFYGFLVADMGNSPFQLNHSRKTISSEPLQQLVSEFDAFQRMQEWLYHERFYEAQSELNLIKPSLTAEQKKMVAYLAQQWKWHHQAILTAAREAIWNDLELRFPTPLPEIFDKYAQKQQLDYPWIIAIARQESAFNPQARSHAGAKGLMQLMPSTAKETARLSKIPYRKESDLYQPKVNIALGTAHLAKLIDSFENNKVFATAAYNAGASRVNSWLKKRGHLPLDIWIETIPYDETRQYVQNVLAFRVIYNSLKEKPVQMLSLEEASMLTISKHSERILSLSDQLLTQRDSQSSLTN